MNCRGFGLFCSVFTSFFLYSVAGITFAATVDTSKTQPKTDNTPVPSVQVPVKTPEPSTIDPSYGIGGQQQPANKPQQPNNVPAPSPAPKQATPQKQAPVKKPAPQEPAAKQQAPANIPAAPAKPAVVKPGISDQQLREMTRIQEQQRKLREETGKRPLPGNDGSNDGGQTADDVVNKILRESKRPVKQPLPDRHKLAPVLTLAEILKNARTISDEPPISLELAPVGYFGTYVISAEDCSRDGYAPRCVSDIYSCDGTGECTKVGEQVRSTNCWESSPGLESCETRTANRRCDSDGQCVTTSVRHERQDCEGERCESRISTYICVPPAPATGGDGDISCPDSSRRHRDSEYSNSDREGSVEWNCDDETGRCEVTRNDRETRDDGSTVSSTEIFDCPDNLRSTELSTDCRMESRTSTECNERGCRTRSYDDQGNEETVVTHEDGSENRTTEQCDTTAGRCVRTIVDTSTDEDGNTTRREETVYCSLRVDGEQTCDSHLIREETCTSRTGRNPRTGEAVMLPGSCTLSISGPGPFGNAGGTDMETPTTTASGCPPGTDNPVRDCDNSTTWVYSCTEGVCGGVTRIRKNTPSLSYTEQNDCQRHPDSPDDSLCLMVNRERHTTLTLPDGSTHKLDETYECERRNGVCEIDLRTTSCTADGLRCTVNRTSGTLCAPFDAGGTSGKSSGNHYFHNNKECSQYKERVKRESWTSTCNAEGECVREGTRTECLKVDVSNACILTGTSYRVEETCDNDTIADGERTNCQVTSSTESYYNGYLNSPVRTVIVCNLDTNVCTKTVIVRGSESTPPSTTSYTCTPATPEEPSPYTNCTEGVIGTTSVPAPGTG